MLVALLPGAAQSASHPTPVPTVTIPPILPLPAEPAPSHRDNSNRYALAELAEHPEHYQCQDYPSSDKVQQQDLIPTANVSMQFEYDPRTKSYQTTVVDPRITLAHHTVTRRMALHYGEAPTDITIDVYQWHYDKGVAHYGAYAYSTPNKPQWVRPYPHLIGGGFYKQELVRERHELNSPVVIIATDTTTCEPGNHLPASLWSGVDHGLIG